MREDALPAARRGVAAGEPDADAAPVVGAAEDAAPRWSAGCFPPRLEIAPLTIRPAASFEIERGLEQRPVC